MINVFEPYITFKDKIKVLKTINSKNISGSSPVIKQFESELSVCFNREYSSAVSNGSVALEVALRIANLKKGDEVILPSFTIISCLAAVVRSGATPVFCDVDIASWNMGLDNVKKAFSNKTKAVLMVHTYGLTAEAEEIEDFCKSNNLFLIEDAAESHGQMYGKRKCGSFGDVSTFSFYANKHITTGEGGALLTDKSELDFQIKQIRNLDFNNKQRFKHENLYWNYRLGGLQASLGISQLQNIENVIKNKKKQAKVYINLINEFNVDVDLPLVRTEKSENNFWVFGIVLKKTGIRNEIIEFMYKHGIETRPFFWPLHLQQIKEFNQSENTLNLKNSEKLGMNGLYLPLGPHINIKKQKFIVSKLKEGISKN